MFRSAKNFALFCTILFGFSLNACSGEVPADKHIDSGQIDSSATADAALSTDAAANSDAGSTLDANHESDSSTARDASTPPDAQAGHDAASTVEPSESCSAISAAIVAATTNTIVVSPGTNGLVTVNGQSKSLRQVVSDANSGDTILLADGTYTFAESDGSNYTGLYFTTPNVVMRSQSGHPQDVILDSNYADHGGESAVITVAAPGIVLADFTVMRSIFHLIHFWSDGDNAQVHNVRLIDGGEQFIKASPGSGNFVDDVKITCNDFIMTEAGHDNIWGYGSQSGSTRCYTGGIDTHDSRNWLVADNRLSGIFCKSDGVQRPAHGKKADLRDGLTYTGGLAEYAIHMWDSPAGSGHVIERNTIINCARGIGLGMASEVYGGLIRNNMIFSEYAGSSEHDVGISIERAHDTSILNNTVFLASANAYANAIEYRWDVSSGLSIRNNLVNQLIRSRNDAQATLGSNNTEAQASWFVDASNGDLHLASCSNAAVDGQAENLAEVSDDVDGDARGSSPDIGADQCTN